LAALTALGSACYAGAEGTIPPPEYAYGYAPVYYDGYVVYCNEGGRPYYYVNGAVTWVPATSPCSGAGRALENVRPRLP
jgi:hypothetical protein